MTRPPPEAIRYSTRQLITFVGFLVLFSAAADALHINLVEQNPMTDRFVMWCPGAATLLTCLVCP